MGYHAYTEWWMTYSPCQSRRDQNYDNFVYRSEIWRQLCKEFRNVTTFYLDQNNHNFIRRPEIWQLWSELWEQPGT